MSKVLLLGGSGLLGSYIVPLLKKYDGDGNFIEHLQIDTPSHKEVDIENPIFREDYDLVINCAAYTDVAKAETDKRKCFESNVKGVIHLLRVYWNVPFVQISSEYAHNPVNYYSETKLAAETAIKAYAEKYLIIRTLFKPYPFPYAKAFKDQYTQGDDIRIIAPLITQAIMHWYLGQNDNQILYVGTGRKTILDIARKSRPEIQECSVDDITEVKIPKNYE